MQTTETTPQFTDTFIAANVGKEQIKISDDSALHAVQGLHIGIGKRGATFFLRFRDKKIQRQRTVYVGEFNLAAGQGTDWAREQARIKLDELATGSDLSKLHYQEKAQAADHLKTFNEVADLYIEDCQKLIIVKGVERPRLKNYKNTISLLKHARKAFGSTLFTEVQPKEIDTLLDFFNDRGQIALANNLRVAISGVYKFGCTHDTYGKLNPCDRLKDKLESEASTTFLTPATIKRFWVASDNRNLPIERAHILGLKLVLATMLRPGEVAMIQRDWIHMDICPRVHIPGHLTKAGRDIVQPLNALALEVIAELMAMDSPSGTLIPEGPKGGAPTSATLSYSLIDLSWIKEGKVYERVGLLSLLDLPKFVPHDLRRTGAKLGRNILRLSTAKIGAALNHAVKTDGDGRTVAAVTAKHYAQGMEFIPDADAIEVLTAWNDFLVTLIKGEPAQLAA